MDFNGGPPGQEGDQVRILVEDNDGAGPTLFEGIVEVNGLYSLRKQGQLFDNIQQITISSLNQTEVLQIVRCSLICESNLEFLARFGSNQLVEVLNEEQGLISPFTEFPYSQGFRGEISIRNSVAGHDFTLSSLVAEIQSGALTDPLSIDLTDEAAGTNIRDGATSTVVFESSIVIYERSKYTASFYFEGTTNSGGNFCNGTETAIFIPGIV